MVALADRSGSDAHQCRHLLSLHAHDENHAEYALRLTVITIVSMADFLYHFLHFFLRVIHRRIEDHFPLRNPLLNALLDITLRITLEAFTNKIMKAVHRPVGKRDIRLAVLQLLPIVIAQPQVELMGEREEVHPRLVAQPIFLVVDAIGDMASVVEKLARHLLVILFQSLQYLRVS